MSTETKIGVLLGGNGTGKSTLARELSIELGWTVLSIDDLVAAAKAQGDALVAVAEKEAQRLRDEAKKAADKKRTSKKKPATKKAAGKAKG